MAEMVIRDPFASVVDEVPGAGDPCQRRPAMHDPAPNVDRPITIREAWPFDAARVALHATSG
jgi:hypothetical protein